jgi:hypothetical protein
MNLGGPISLTERLIQRLVKGVHRLGVGGNTIRVVGDIMMHSHTDAVSKMESLNSQKQKRLSHRSPTLEFVHLLQQKNYYSLNAAAEQVDHSGCKLFVIILQPIYQDAVAWGHLDRDFYLDRMSELTTTKRTTGYLNRLNKHNKFFNPEMTTKALPQPHQVQYLSYPVRRSDKCCWPWLHTTDNRTSGAHHGLCWG